MDAIALLKKDHEHVAALFEQYETASDEDRMSLAGQICQLLTLHARIEEEIFYPHARAVLGGGQQVDGGLCAHESVKALVAQIEAAASTDAVFHVKIRVLNEYVAHHVREEELELFPRLEESTLDLAHLGRTLRDRKADLMVLLGTSEIPGDSARSPTEIGS